MDVRTGLLNLQLVWSAVLLPGNRLRVIHEEGFCTFHAEFSCIHLGPAVSQAVNPPDLLAVT